MGLSLLQYLRGRMSCAGGDKVSMLYQMSWMCNHEDIRDGGRKRAPQSRATKKRERGFCGSPSVCSICRLEAISKVSKTTCATMLYWGRGTRHTMIDLSTLFGGAFGCIGSGGR